MSFPLLQYKYSANEPKFATRFQDLDSINTIQSENSGDGGDFIATPATNTAFLWHADNDFAAEGNALASPLGISTGVVTYNTESRFGSHSVSLVQQGTVSWQHNTSDLFDNNDFSIDFWVRPLSYFDPDFGTFFSVGSYSFPNNTLTISHSAGTNTFSTVLVSESNSIKSYSVTGTTLNNATWHYFALSRKAEEFAVWHYDGTSTSRIIYDNSKLGSTEKVKSLTSEDDRFLHVGAFPINYEESISAYYDEVRIVTGVCINDPSSITIDIPTKPFQIQ